MLKDKVVGFGITGSFCSMDAMLKVLQQLVDNGCDVHVFLSDSILKYDTRFNSSSELVDKIQKIIDKKMVTDLVGAELYGPKIPLDVMVVYPCTGNTLAKLSHGINDNAVTMACKATLRNNKPVVLGVYSNDILSNSGVNLFKLLNIKNYFLIPMYQDDIVKKPFSMVANEKYAIETITLALNKEQLQPLFVSGKDG